MYVLQGQKVATKIVYVEEDIFMPVCKKIDKKKSLINNA